VGIRPWNSHNTKDRYGGAYYQSMWRAAIMSDASVIRYSSLTIQVKYLGEESLCLIMKMH